MQHGEHEPAVRAILRLVQQRTGADFFRYRPDTVGRRIRNRMISLGVASTDAYLNLLTRSEPEAGELVQRVTIKVSRFYRNPESFDAVREALPEISAMRGSAPIRIWSAGSACGEEPYTLAMLLAHAGYAGSIEATDLDPRALAAAELGVYGPEAVSELPGELASRYLEPVGTPKGTMYRVCDEVRRRVRFSQHDLTSDAPPPGGGTFDLVSCRNVLIYFLRDAQLAALTKVRAAVADGGFLLLGEAEWPPAAVAASLSPRGRKTKLFKAVSPMVDGDGS
jgi:chemotaxis protein methyltransferase CheR